ncbi:MAG TPA: beta-propeller domain-containing protein, partial [Acidimicrobiales bacterium]
ASAPTSNSGSDGGTSTTNTQEVGIGEPDLVWTDGTRLVTVVNGSLQIVDLAAGTVTATIDLQSDESGGSPVGLMVEGEHAVVIHRSYGTRPTASGGVRDGVIMAAATTTVLNRVDLGAEPAVVGEVVVDGDYVDARMVDGVVRTVVRSFPAELGWVYPSNGNESSMRRAEEANRAIVAESTLEDWLPSMSVSRDGTESTSAAVDCDAVDHPAQFGGFEVVTVVGLDLGAGATQPLPSAAVVAGAGTVYASPDHLYVSTTRYPEATGSVASIDDTDSTTSVPTTTPEESDEVRTAVHSFALPSDVAATYEGSGSVPGQLLDQFALSEHEGDLRVASTTLPSSWWGQPEPAIPGGGRLPDRPAEVTESRVTVLRLQDDELVTVGEVTGLGPTEQIRGVRFAGPLAYVVTFRQTDPLYVVDLHDPTAPIVAGELKIPGFSSYLQVIGEGRVLGLGQDATDTGRTTGFQESLFDVSDPGQPTRLANLVVPDSSSLAEEDHHAVLWWEPDRLLAVPVTGWGAGVRAGAEEISTVPGNAVLVTRVTDTAIEQVGTIRHPAVTTRGGGSSPCPPNANCVMPIEPDPATYAWNPPIVRTVMADGRLVTVSNAGVKVSDPTTLADLAWIPLA